MQIKFQVSGFEFPAEPVGVSEAFEPARAEAYFETLKPET